MKAIVFIGMFALFLLVQTPFILSLDDEICEEIPNRYEDECEEILELDLRNSEKRYLIEHLDDVDSVPNISGYPSPFTDVPAEEIPEDNYSPRENFAEKFSLVSKMMVFIFVNCSFYKAFKKYFGGALCSVA